MRRTSALAVAGMLGLVVLGVRPGVPGSAVAADPSAVAQARVLEFWTPERMRDAVPRDFVRGPTGVSVRAPIPPVAAAGTVSGGTWPDGRGPIYRTVGKVYFEMGGVAYVCSGAVTSDGDLADGRSLVLTAGHCAYDEVHRVFATNWLFIPEFASRPTFRCADTAHGCWSAIALVVGRAYATAGAFNDQATDHDYAFAVVEAGTNGTQLDATVGAYPIDASDETAEQRVAFGYPQAEPWDGTNLGWCAGSPFEDAHNGIRTWGLGCNMTAGSSGGPWLSGFDERTGTGGRLSSVSSYGYAGVQSVFGPKFDRETLAVYEAALTVAGNSVVN